MGSNVCKSLWVFCLKDQQWFHEQWRREDEEKNERDFFLFPPPGVPLSILLIRLDIDVYI